MALELTDDETAALTKELHDIVENDRYLFSPRIRAAGKSFKAIAAGTGLSLNRVRQIVREAEPANGSAK
jgi:hypothetical protein